MHNTAPKGAVFLFERPRHMIELSLIGIGTGNPQHLTLQAVAL